MRKVWLLAAFFLIFYVGISEAALATFVPGDLAIIELKMTGSESIVLENTSGATINLQNYVIQYFNKSTGINFSVPTDSQQLPSFSLSDGQSFLLSGDNSATCGAAGESNLGLSMSDTNGYIEIAKVAQAGSTITYTAQDHASWTSSAGTSGDGIDLHSVGLTAGAINSTNSVYYRKLIDGSWQRFGIDNTPCNLFVSVTPASSTTFVQWANGDGAPATIIADADSSSGAIPLADIGLASPQITEILPNPAPPQSDDEDEFIELYNPNNSLFDLTGLKLQVGTKTKRTYTFPNGTTMSSKSFSAFMSVDTGLAMSNSGGQVALIDPLGNVMFQTDIYGTAKDGQAWALANGKWYWTTTPTPNAPNAIKGAVGAVSSKKSKGTTSTLGSSSSGSSGSTSANSSTATPAPIHPWTLAGVGAAALLYAGYEYRADLANNVYRLRRYYAARTASGGGFIASNASGIGQRFGRWQNHLRDWLGQRSKK